MYFSKGGQKKVAPHLEWTYIDSKMCSGTLEAKNPESNRHLNILDTLHILSHAKRKYVTFSLKLTGLKSIA